MYTIGVFDSGIGGKSVAEAISKAMPEHKIIFRNDQMHLPYGNKTKQELLDLSLPILKDMEDMCDVMVIACNTLTTNVIKDLRLAINVPLIAIEPMVKPAVKITKSSVIAVCATPSTLASDRYKVLKRDYAKGIKVIEPDCSNWAELLEKNELTSEEIRKTTEEIISKGADVIVLGCTHYHWIESDIVTIVNNKAIVLQPEQAIIRRLSEVLEQLS